MWQCSTVLAPAFMRIRVLVTDEQGNRVVLELRVPGAAYRSDRLVFGLAIGPLALTSALAAMREIVKRVVPEAAAVGDRGIEGDSKKLIALAQLRETWWPLA